MIEKEEGPPETILKDFYSDFDEKVIEKEEGPPERILKDFY